jgi:hypothetical protein
MSLSVLLAGGAGIAPADQFIGSFTLGVEWGFREPFAVGVDIGLETLRVGVVTEGKVSMLLHWASLYGRVVLFARGLSGLHVNLGARLVRMSAWSEGFTTTQSADIYGGAAVLAIEWRQEVTRHFLLFGRLGAQARFAPETFSVGGVGTVLTLPPWGFWAQLGASWNFL